MGFLDMAFSPLWTGPSRAAKFLADKIDNPQGEGSFLRGLLAGGLEGAGDVVSDMTSPASIASSALGGSGMSALRRGKRLLSPSSSLAPIRQNYMYSDEGRDLASLYDRMGPEFVPIGGEDVLNATRGSREAANLAKFKPAASEQISRSSLGGDDVAAKMAKVTAARSAAKGAEEVKGKADFLGFQDDFAGGGFNLYNVNWPGHPMDKSTITEEAAKKMGLL